MITENCQGVITGDWNRRVETVSVGASCFLKVAIPGPAQMRASYSSSCSSAFVLNTVLIFRMSDQTTQWRNLKFLFV